MFKKVLKVLWWVSKWYLKLTVLYWAFIGLAEAALETRMLEPLFIPEKLRNKKGAWSRHTKTVNKTILEKALWKYKFGFYMTDEKTEEKTEESGA